MRRLAFVAVVAVVAVGCEGKVPPTSPRSTQASAVPSRATPAPSTPAAPASDTDLPSIVLTASLGDPPVRWPLLAHVRFGDRQRDLGLLNDRRHTATPIYPPSFAVDSDGSMWILDIVKHRVAHYSLHGRFLGEAAGVRFDRHTPLPVDIAFTGDTLWLLSHRTPVHGILQPVSEAGVQPPHGVSMSGQRPAAVTTLYPSSGPDVLGRVEGLASRDPGLFGTGRAGVAELMGDGGKVRFLPGYPLLGGRFMDLSMVPPSDQDLEIEFTSRTGHSIRPIHVRLQPADGARPIPAIVQFEFDTGTAHGILASVGVGPARSKDQRAGDGRWLLGLFDDGSPLIWERLPEPSVEPEWATRTITTAADGAIYLMVAQPDGVSIFRRPARP
jgi:hypothetical protein